MSLQLHKNQTYASMSLIPREVFQIYDHLESKFSSRIRWDDLTEVDLWNELCLCILSSNVPFELATSAVKHLSTCGMLDTRWLVNNVTAKQILESELSKSAYLPKKKDGNLRKYRFPRVRSRDIVNAADSLYGEGKNIQYLLSNENSPEIVRNFLADTISGLGLKESSHFLRNIGYASSLAIVDVHIVSFLRDLGLFQYERKPITITVYLELERIMQKISRMFDLNLAILDNAIWHYMRTKSNP